MLGRAVAFDDRCRDRIVDLPALEEVVDLLVGAGLADSKGAARRSIKEGGAYVNNVRIEDEAWSPAESDYLHGAWLVLRRGKKNFAGAKRV